MLRRQTKITEEQKTEQHEHESYEKKNENYLKYI